MGDCLGRTRRFLRSLFNPARTRPHRPVRRVPRFTVDRVEARVLLSTLAIGNGNAASYNASRGFDNTLSAEAVPDAFIITDAAERIIVSGRRASACTGSGTHSVTCPRTAIRAMTLSLDDGDDALAFTNVSFAVTVFGGLGNDTLRTGNAADSVIGDEGDDQLFGGGDDDELQGKSGSDLIDGGGGDDSLLERADVSFQLVGDRLTGIGNDLILRVETVNLRGGSGNNVLDVTGFRGTAFLDGDNGNDTLIGGNGADWLFGNGGIDSLQGGPGSDTLDGGSSGDRLDGGAGDDELRGGTDTSSDTLRGGDGMDRVVESSNTNFTITPERVIGRGSDQINSVEAVFVSGGRGNNRLNASAFAGSVTLDGGTGDDTLIGGTGSDDLRGGVGRDSIVGGHGDDTLTGGDGADADVLDGGDQFDVIVETTTTDLSLSNGELSGAADDLIRNVEAARLTILRGHHRIDASQFSGAVTLQGGTGRDTLIGGSGHDRIDGGVGNDVLTGGVGNDSLDGDDGRDTLLGSAGDDTLLGGDGTDSLDGNDGFDHLLGGAEADTLSGGLGDDLVDGGASAQDLWIESGDSDFLITAGQMTGLGVDRYLAIEMLRLTAGPSNNTIFGSGFTGALVVDAGTGDDRITGSGHDDTLIGGDGNDTLTGNDGNDRLDGGLGDDLVSEARDTSFSVSTTTMRGLGSDELVSIDRAVLVAGDGDNILRAESATFPVTLVGGGGNDQLGGGSANDQLLGGDGDDTIRGGGGDDLVNGGLGTDRLVEQSESDLLLSDALLVGLGSDQLTSIEEAELSGGRGSNRLDASQFTGPVVLVGLNGDDVLIGGAGADRLDGGLGHDVFTGGSGDDTIEGGGGTDLLVEIGDTNFTLTPSQLTGVGNDSIVRIRHVHLTGGLSANRIDAALFNGLVTLQGGDGGDTLVGGLNADVLLGEAGDDDLSGGAGSDTIHGGDGADTILGALGVDQLFGDAGFDSLYGDVTDLVSDVGVDGGSLVVAPVG